ncbi:MAG: IS110 family transposase, partial [Cyanobacteria bacterium J06641_5]
VNNLKQLLAWQFPERAQVKMRRLNGKVNPFVRWAAEGCPHRIYDPQHERTAGAGLSDESRFHAQRLLSIQTEVLKLELELEELLCGEQFTVYRRVFERFGFGDRLQGAILAHAYPLEEILDEHKRPVKERRRGTISGKMVTNNISRRKFQNILGCVPGEDSSGDMFRSRVTGGSELVRKLLWLWQLTRIEPKGSRPKSLVCQELGDAMDRRKATGEPVRKLRMRQLSVTAKFLFNHLVAELHT